MDFNEAGVAVETEGVGSASSDVDPRQVQIQFCSPVSQSLFTF